MTAPDFEIRARSILARGSLVELEQISMSTPGEGQVVRDIVRHPGGVAVLPLDGDHVWLIRQYRVALGREVDEIPAGKREADDGGPEASARRELREELGATAARFEHLATMAPSPGYTDEVIEIYLAEDLEFSDRTPDGAEERSATVFSLPIAEAMDSIGSGRIIDAKTQVALLEWNRRRI